MDSTAAAAAEVIDPQQSGQDRDIPVDASTSKDEEQQTLGGTAALKSTDSPPDGGYGWVCIAAIFFINAHTWGINSSYGVFLQHFLNSNYFPDATTFDFAVIGGLSVGVAMLVAPATTVITRRYGTRVTLFIGILFETASLIGASFASQIWQLFLSQGVCFGIGMGALFTASVGIAPQWFKERRSLANGITAAGSGFGGLTYSLAVNAMIKSVGLHWAYRILGIVAAGVNTICALLLRDRLKALGSAQLAFDYRLFRRPEFLLLQAFGFLSLLGYIVLLFSLPSYATSIGLTAQQGSIINAVLQLGQMCGRPPIGFFSDSFGRINMATTMTLIAGLLTPIIWVPARSYAPLLVFAFLGGTVAGTYWTTIAPLAAEVLGLRDLPSGLSITWVMLVLPSVFSEAIALEITERSSSGYLGTQLFAAFMYIGAALCLLPARAWKIGQLELAVAERKDIVKGQRATGAAGASDPYIKRSTFFKRLTSVKKV